MKKKYSSSEVVKLTGVSKTKLFRVSNPSRNQRGEREYTEKEVLDLINNQEPWERERAVNNLQREISTRENEIDYFKYFLAFMTVALVVVSLVFFIN